MTDRELMQQALEALLWANKEINGWRDDAYGYEAEDQPEIMSAVNAIKEALAQPVQEPKGYFSVNDYGRWEENENEYGTPLYTAPPQRKPLTDEEIDELPWGPYEGNPVTFAEGLRDFARAIERAHGIGDEK